MSDKTNDSNNPSEDEQLTPWQIANRKYLEEQAKKAVEQNRESTDEDDLVDEENEAANEISEEELEKIEEEIEEKTTGEPYNGSFADRLPNLKTQRNRILYKRLSIIFIVLSIPLLFLVYYISPLSKLAKVEVTGNKEVTANEVVSGMKLETGENLWDQYFHKKTYISNLEKKQPRIKSASIQLENLNQLKVNVAEYDEVALVSKNDQYYPVLENGTVLSEAIENPTKNLPILENFTSDAKIKEFLKEYKQLSSEKQKTISEVKYAPSDSNKELLNLYMNDGNQVIINISNLVSQMKYYSKVAKDMDGTGVIDMEVGIFSYSTSEDTEDSGTEETDTSTTNSEDTDENQENT